jgi:hypothetical protein
MAELPLPTEPAVLKEPLAGVSPRATSIRWLMMALVTATAILTYLDRLNLGIAGKFIQDEYSIPLKTMGWILSAFLLGYSLSQVPGGYLSDRFGPRRVLIAAIAWWSVLTATTALAPRLFSTGWFGVAWSFAIVRFLIGIGEAPSSPAYTKVVANEIERLPFAWRGRLVCPVSNPTSQAGRLRQASRLLRHQSDLASPLASHLGLRNAPLRHQPPRSHAADGSQRYPHDASLSQGHSA